MGVKDKHDPREFRHFEKVDRAGTVLAVVEVADGHPDPTDESGCVYREITEAVAAKQFHHVDLATVGTRG